MLQIPVIIMITGGSDFICAKFGRRLYQLLLGFLPLTCALSGNVGLQASAVTTRAILCNHVTPESYGSWFIQEVVVAACLGLGIGIVMGIIAYFSSLQDFAFGITILFAQCFSSLIAGITGTLGPILFNAIFKHNTSLWGTLMITTIQDVFGCFVLVFVSYHIFSIFTDGDVELSDRCIVKI
jgi:magnesium transporter